MVMDERLVCKWVEFNLNFVIVLLEISINRIDFDRHKK